MRAPFTCRCVRVQDACHSLAAHLCFANEENIVDQETIDRLEGARARLMTQQERLVARNEDVLSCAAREHRHLSADDKRSIERRTAEVERMQGDIDAIDSELSKPQPRVAPPNTVDPLNSPLGQPGRNATPRIAPIVNLAEPPQRPTAAALFGQQAAPVGGASEDTFSRWLFAVASRDTGYLMTNRPQAAGAYTGIGVEGGFAVPPAWSAALLNSIAEQSFFLSRCRVLPMDADVQSFPVLNSYDRTKGPGKFIAEKKAEGLTATVQTAAFEEITLRSFKAITYWSVTQEMLQGALPGTDQALIRAAGGAIAMQLDREIWSGTGVAEMLGVTNSPATIVHAKDSGQSANTVTFTNLSGVLARLLPSSYRSAVWFTSPSTLPQLLSVYNPVLNAGNVVGGLPAPMTQLADGSYALFGRPLVVSDFCPALSATGDVALVDLGQYLIGMREQLRVEISPHAMFSEDKVAFKVVQRRAGMPIPTQPFTPAVGSTTLSPFVQLQAR